MPIMIFWLIVIAVVISNSAKKNKKGRMTGSKTKTGQLMNGSKSMEQMPKKSHESQQELKERLAKKYNKNAESDILQRAKEAVTEEFSDSESQKSKQQELEKRIEQKLNMQQKDEVKEKESVLDVVNDLMIKGPNTELSFERDFLAEGMDMLNRIQA